MKLNNESSHNIFNKIGKQTSSSNFKTNDDICKNNLHEKNNFPNNFHRSFSSKAIDNNNPNHIKNIYKFNNHNFNLLNTKYTFNDKNGLFISKTKNSTNKNLKKDNENENNINNKAFNLPFYNENNVHYNNFINIGKGIEYDEKYKNKLHKNYYSNDKDINFEKEHNKHDREIYKLKKENNSLISKLKKAEQNNELSRLKLDEQQKEIITLKNKLIILNDIIKQKNINISCLKENIINYNISNDEKEKDIQTLTSKLLKIESDANNINKTYELLHNEQVKNQYLKEEINSIKQYTDKSEKLLNLLFNFFNSINYLINYIPNKNPERKEILNDVIKYENLEDFENKLKKVIKKCEKNVKETRLRIGKYFPCDITCCTTKNERIKYFKNK